VGGGNEGVLSEGLIGRRIGDDQSAVAVMKLSVRPRQVSKIIIEETY